MEIVAAIVGVIVGFILSEGRRSFGEKSRNKTNFCALRAEINFCSDLAKIYVKDRKMAPLYRLPTAAYEAALPQLLSASAINEVELKAIQQFYMQVESLNRGLDQAELARNDRERLEAEYNRNLGKAAFLIPSDETRNSYYTEANNLLQKRCK